MQSHQSTRQSGFSIIEVMLFVLVFAALAVTGVVVYQRHNRPSSAKNSADTNTSQTTTQPHSTTTTQPAPDPYAGWQTYTNSTYGFSFKYPPAWISTGDVTTDATTRSISATKQKFGTGLTGAAGEKYGNTVDIEVLGEDLPAATAFYDSYYAQSPLNKVTKTPGTLKGKQAVSYDVVNSGNDSKLYLFGVGSKTYTFSSINEELNVQKSPDYWTTFQKVFDSLSLQ